MSKLRVLNLSQINELDAYMRPVRDMVIDVLGCDRPNGEAIRDAMLFSREFAYAKIGFEFDWADMRSALEDIARDYMGCKETWKSIIRIAEKGKWVDLAETAADYVVGDVGELVLLRAMQRALQTEAVE